MSLTDRIPQHRRGTAALLLIMTGSLGIQCTAALASSLFGAFTPTEVAALRALLAAVTLLLLVRPNPLNLSRKDWGQVVVYGAVLTLMSICFYNAIALIPLGVAVTFEYLGAFLVALLGVRQLRDGLFALFALAGVIMIASSTMAGDAAPIGFLWALGSAASMAGYTLYSARMGTVSPATAGLRGTALALGVSALMQLPLAVPAVSRLDAGAWLILAITAVFGVALAYSADNIAGQLTSAAVIGVLFSIDPVIGAIAGTVLLGEVLSWWAYAGIALIAASGAYIVWSTNRSAIHLTAHTGMLPVTSTPPKGKQS